MIIIGFSLSAHNSKTNFIIAVDSERIVLCTALRLLLYGLVTGVGANKESVHIFCDDKSYAL